MSVAGNRDLELCDSCGVCFDVTVTGQHFTDDEVCDGGDGPGFFLCRPCCRTLPAATDLFGAPVEVRRERYTAQRAINDARKAVLDRSERVEAIREDRQSRADRDTGIMMDLIASQGAAWCASMLAAACDMASDEENVTEAQYEAWSRLEHKAEELANEIRAMEEECS